MLDVQYLLLLSKIKGAMPIQASTPTAVQCGARYLGKHCMCISLGRVFVYNVAQRVHTDAC